MAAPIPVKASAFFSYQKKIQLLRNTTTYTWDWLCHLVGDRGLLSYFKAQGAYTSFFTLVKQK